MKKFLIGGSIVSVLILGLAAFVVAKYNLGVVGPQKATGTIVSISSFLNDDFIVGIDIDGDGKGDIKAHTNAVLGNDIMHQCCTMHEEPTEDAHINEIKMFSPVQAEVLRVTFADGSFWEQNVPKYIVMKYGDDVKPTGAIAAK